MNRAESSVSQSSYDKNSVRTEYVHEPDAHELFGGQNKKPRYAILIADLVHSEPVEGLLTRGAMKADDRPLWFDVYRAFPPLAEPKFAKPKPEMKPIRQILYPEDTIRAKFHSNGHGLGAVSMISQTETQTKRLVQQYKKLKTEGVPEDELIEKSAALVGSERQLKATEVITNTPGPITANVLAEADIKNIFTEK